MDLDLVRTTTVAGIGDAGRGFAGITDPGYNGCDGNAKSRAGNDRA
jgi:hypothetical protein